MMPREQWLRRVCIIVGFLHLKWVSVYAAMPPTPGVGHRAPKKEHENQAAVGTEHRDPTSERRTPGTEYKHRAHMGFGGAKCNVPMHIPDVCRQTNPKLALPRQSTPRPHTMSNP